jgi:hypothetical protein
MDTHSKEERISRGVCLLTMCLAAFSCGAYTNHAAGRGNRSASAPSQLDLASCEDGGAGFPASLVTEEDLRPGGPQRVLVCDDQSCRLPGPEPVSTEDRHNELTYVQDKGGVVILDRSTLVATSCNEACTVCVEQFGEHDRQYDGILEGERVDRADRDVRYKRIDRVESCTFERADEDAAPGNNGYVISHVRVVPSTAFIFDPKTGAYKAEEQ